MQWRPRAALLDAPPHVPRDQDGHPGGCILRGARCQASAPAGGHRREGPPVLVQRGEALQFLADDHGAPR
eukprot:6587186-Pyramimonas_sp.AAC.1